MKREGIFIAGVGGGVALLGGFLWFRARRRFDSCVAAMEPGSGKLCDFHEEAMWAYLALGVGLTGVVTGGAVALITE